MDTTDDAVFFSGLASLFLSLRSPSTVSPSPHPAAVPQRARPCLTRRRVLFFFFLWRRRSQAESIRLRSKRKGKEKEPTWASWGKDCISRHEPQDGRTGQHASETDSLPLVHAGARRCCNDASLLHLYIIPPKTPTHCICFSAALICTSAHPTNKHFHMHGSRSYLCDTGLGGEM